MKTSHASFIAKELVMLCLSVTAGVPTVSAQVVYFHADTVGSPIAATDQNGNLLWREHYQPFGTRIEVQGGSAGNRQWYLGKYHDSETGLTYSGARLYDPIIGRFMGVDPVGIVETNPFSFNRYQYANDNPFAYVDPEGTYARGTGFTDSQWNTVDRAQNSIAKKLEEAADRIDSALNTGDRLKAVTKRFERTFGDGTATRSNMSAMANDFRLMAVALRDSGSGGYVANGMNAQQWAAANRQADALASASVGGMLMTINLDHARFEDAYVLSWAVGHEAAHNIGKQHGVWNNVTAYRYGLPAQRQVYRDLADLSPSEALHNPDHFLKFLK